MELDVHADVFWEATREQPRALQCGEIAGMCRPDLESLHVGVHRGTKQQPGQVREMIGAEGGSETLLAVASKIRPRRLADVSLQDKVPLLGDPLEMIRGHPDFVHFARQLAAEELLTFVEPAQRVTEPTKL
jgi:hypothetical protein